MELTNKILDTALLEKGTGTFSLTQKNLRLFQNF